MDLDNSRTDAERDSLPDNIERVTIQKALHLGETMRVRIIQGAEYREILWWPTFAIDRQTRQNKQTWRSLSLAQGDTTPIDDLAMLDKKMKAHVLASIGKDPADAKSSFSRSRKYLYAAIIRSSQGDRIKVLEVPWSVVEGIRRLKSMQMENGKLAYGLPYMYDIAISLQTDTKTKRNAYVPGPWNCNTSGMIDAKYIDEKNCKYPNKREFFSPEDLELIDACSWELTDIDAPQEKAKLKEMLAEFPIDLSRRKKEPNQMYFYFFSTQLEYEVLTKKLGEDEVNYLIPQETEIRSLNPGPEVLVNALKGLPLPDVKKIINQGAQAPMAAIAAPSTGPQVVHAEVSSAAPGATTMTAPVYSQPAPVAPTPVPAPAPAVPAYAQPAPVAPAPAAPVYAQPAPAPAPVAPLAPVAEPSRVAEAVAPTFAAPPGPAPAPMAPAPAAPAPAAPVYAQPAPVAPAPAPAPVAPAAPPPPQTPAPNRFKGRW